MMAAFWEKVKRMFKKEQRVVILGKMGARATTILNKLKYQPQVESICRHIYTVKTVLFRDMRITYLSDAINLTVLIARSCPKGNFHFNDCMRDQYVRGQFEMAQGIIYVFDIAGIQSFQEQVAYFRTIINNQWMSKHTVPILIFANKTDLCPLSQEEIGRMIPLEQIKQPYKVQRCCAIIAEGLDEGM